MRISKPDISIPRPNIRQKAADSLVWRLRLFILAGLVAIAGLTCGVGGLVLIGMMAVAGSAQGVVAASLMFAVGVVLLVADYIWLTL